MKYTNLSSFLEAYKSLSQLGFTINRIFDRIQKINPIFNVDELKNELGAALNDAEFDWVDFALDTEAVMTSLDSPPKEFKVDDLLIYSGLVGNRSDMYKEGMLTEEQREKLRGQLRDIDIHSFSNIHELMDSEQFSWLPFVTKQAYKLAFGEIFYTEEDIVYYIKSAVWDCFFSGDMNEQRMELISQECNELLKAYATSNGWMDMDEMVEAVSEKYPEVDAYVLTKVKWDKETQKLNHFRNHIALGFKRNQF
jgi:hypothetical protein